MRFKTGKLARQFAQADGARLGRQSDREVRPDRTDVKAVDTEADDDGKPARNELGCLVAYGRGAVDPRAFASPVRAGLIGKALASTWIESAILHVCFVTSGETDSGEDGLALLRRPGVAPSRRDFADVRRDEPRDVYCCCSVEPPSLGHTFVLPSPQVRRCAGAICTAATGVHSRIALRFIKGRRPNSIRG